MKALGILRPFSILKIVFVLLLNLPEWISENVVTLISLKSFFIVDSLLVVVREVIDNIIIAGDSQLTLFWMMTNRGVIG
ncbi:hypothetical protein ACH3XW_40470 [Acanthocheilonema viteae]